MAFATSDSGMANRWLKDRILLDSCAQTSSFCNENFVKDIRNRGQPIKYVGQAQGEEICREQATFMDAITVDYHPDFMANILSPAELRGVYGFHVDYEDLQDRFRLYVGDKEMFFINENNLYTYDPSEDYDIVRVHTTMITKAQERQAEEAQKLMRRLGYPSPQRMISALRDGAITNAGVSPEDIKRGDAIFGRPYPYLAGKAVWRDPSLPPKVRAEILPDTELEGHTDIMYLMNNQVVSLVTVFKPIDLVICSIMDGLGLAEKKKHFSNQIAVIKGAGFTIKSIQGDAGDGFGAALQAIQGPTFIPRAPGRHVGIVEAMIRRIKETTRALLHSLPFRYNVSLVKWAVKCATFYQNLFPSRDGFKGISPREALTGIKVDLKSSAPIAFGEFAYVKEKLSADESRTITSRVFPGIALMPVGHGGAVEFLNLETMNVIRRDQWTVTKIPLEIINKMNTAIGTYGKEDIAQVLDTNDDPIEDEEPEIQAAPQPAVVNMTVEQAAKEYGADVAEDSLEKEFQQYHNNSTFRGVPAGEKVDPSQVVNFKAFAKPKKDPDGVMTSLKTRGVGRGDMQNPTIYEKMSSPTASTQSLFTVATIGAHEGKKNATYDFPGA